ncbi:MAG: Na+ dependent nucleoside transporter N-terminal domain-containing protein, partial [Flavobacteriales bacterium]
MSILHGLFGVVVLTLIAWLLSSNRKKVNWRTVGGALILQIILAVLILKVPFVERIFDVIASGFVKVINFTDFGSDFLFGSFLDDNKVHP